MALPKIVFNATTGSDTAASGAGPSTAVTGSAAAHTDGVASATITLTNSPDLSGVATDGSHCLWLKTPSGRQFSKIVGVDDTGKTVTVEDTFTIASDSAVDYAIGGKRATWDNTDSRKIFADAKAGWVIETETDQTLTSVVDVGASGTNSGYITVRGNTDNPRPVVTQSASGDYGFDLASATYGEQICWEFAALHFKHSGATRQYMFRAQEWISGPVFIWRNCICGDVPKGNNPSGLITYGNQRVPVVLIDCTIRYCSSVAINCGASTPQLYHCHIHHCGGAVRWYGWDGDFLLIDGCLFHDCSGHAIQNSSKTGDKPVIIRNSIFANNGGTGIKGNSSGGERYWHISQNIFAGNGGYGIDLLESQINSGLSELDWNAYYNNTSGNISNGSIGPNSIQLTADPFVDAANGDFNINDAPGGGALLRAAHFTIGAE